MQSEQLCTKIEILRVIDVDLETTAEKLKARLCLLDGVLQADVNCSAGKIYVEYDPSIVSPEDLKEVVQITTLQFDDNKIIFERGRG